MKKIVLILFMLAFVGCEDKAPLRAAPIANVTTAKTTAQDLPIYLTLPGSTRSVHVVDIKARTEGWLLERHFKEGAVVEQGDLLYQIDSEQYEAELLQAESVLEVAAAQFDYAKKEYERNEPLTKNGAISQQAFDALATQYEQATAQIDSAQAGVEVARLNVEYCEVRAPISGVIGKTTVDVGSLVGPNSQSALASIVQENPMYVECNPPASRLPMIKEALETGGLPILVTQTQDNSEGQAIGAQQGLDEIKINGAIVFIDNSVDEATSTFLVRGEFINTTNILAGQYVEVRLQINMIQDAIMVPTNAIAQQPGGFYVWTISDKNTAEMTPVILGAVSGKYTHAQSGLKVGEEVIVSGLTNLRTGLSLSISSSVANQSIPKSSQDQAP